MATEAAEDEATANAMYAPQAHGLLSELILRLDGHPRILCGNRWLTCEDDRPRVFLPGARHSECWRARDSAYALLWGYQLPQGILFNITQYEPGRGYFVAAQKMLVLSPLAADMWCLAAAPSFTGDRHAKATFVTLFLKILADHIQNADDSALSTAEYHERVISQIRDYICTHLAEDLPVERLAAMVCYSAAHFGVLFRRHVGTSVHHFVLEGRLEKARQMLDSGRHPVGHVAESVGFRDQLYFSKAYRKRFGVCPSRTRQDTGAARVGERAAGAMTR